MKTAIDLAREAGFPERRSFSDLSDLYPRLERLVELARADAIAETHRQCLEIAEYCADADMHASMAANCIKSWKVYENSN